jgi:xylulose-5-phosphate/fructose-6-phosphate phosphoketolase
MAVINDIDRFHLVGDVIDRVPSLGYTAAYVRQYLRDQLVEHRQYINQRGQDMPAIRNWSWPLADPSMAGSEPES